MAITPQAIDRLQATLLTSGLQQTNQALYQVINQLIQAARDSLSGVQAINTTIGGGGGSGANPNLHYLTHQNDVASLPNSRELLAGVYIAFDDTVANERTVNGTEWTLLTNGDPINPELIFVAGDVVMIHTP